MCVCVCVCACVCACVCVCVYVCVCVCVCSWLVALTNYTMHSKLADSLVHLREKNATALKLSYYVTSS